MKRIVQLSFIACCLVIAPVPAGPLLDAAKAGNDMQVDRILKSGVDIRERGLHGDTALHWMAFHGNEAMVRRLIAAGAAINERVEKGSTPLHLAAYNGHTAVAKLLIEHGAKVNAQTRAGITPLDWAERNGRREVAHLLIANDAKAGRTPSSDGATANHRKFRQEDLKYFPLQNQTATRYGLSQAPGGASSLTGTAQGKIGHLDNPPQAGLFRIQLAALSSEQRAVEAWTLYCRQHPDILGDRELILDRVNLKGKSHYRVQTGLLTRHNAQSMCDQLKRRSQSCIVINPESL